MSKNIVIIDGEVYIKQTIVDFNKDDFKITTGGLNNLSINFVLKNNILLHIYKNRMFVHVDVLKDLGIETHKWGFNRNE